MTDRHTAYIVTLNTPIRDDDAEATISALQQIKGVIDVRPVVADLSNMAPAIRMDIAWRKAIDKLLDDGPNVPLD